MRSLVILFAKAPVAGGVKTRLLPQLTAVEAAEFHECLVRDALALLSELDDVAEIELHTDTKTDAWSDLAVRRHLQAAGDLGARLYHSLANGLASGYPQVTVVGSDAPTLPISYLRELLDSAGDVALGPCEDGGYYAIACRRTHPRMFEGVKWSSPLALDQTVLAARACGLRVELSKTWWDVDDASALERLAALTDLPPHTAGFLRRLRGCGMK